VQADSDLTKAVLDGQKEAFAKLVRRYERPVQAIAISILGDYHNVQDAVQDAFVAGYKNLSMLRNRNSFGPWLMQIAHRCALSWANRRPEGTPVDTNPVVAAENPDGRVGQQKYRNRNKTALLGA
jgi:RNA polymerase sigma-70 factor (ECF subfamily)